MAEPLQIPLGLLGWGLSCLPGTPVAALTNASSVTGKVLSTLCFRSSLMDFLGNSPLETLCLSTY